MDYTSLSKNWLYLTIFWYIYSTSKLYKGLWSLRTVAWKKLWNKYWIFMNNTSSVCWPEHLGEHSCCESLCQNADPAVLNGLHRHLWLCWSQGGDAGWNVWSYPSWTPAVTTPYTFLMEVKKWWYSVFKLLSLHSIFLLHLIEKTICRNIVLFNSRFADKQ